MKNRSKLILDDPVDSGSFGKVYKARWDKQPVAVKILPYNKNAVEICESEKSIMEKLTRTGAPHTVKYMGAIQSPTDYKIVMELVENGNLGFYMLSHPSPSWQEKSRLIYEVTEGLAGLHERGYIYADLKADNVLLDKDLHVKLCDFGLTFKKTEKLQKPRGTFSYAAPELVEKDQKINNEKSDVYSWAVLARNIAAWKEPYRFKHPSEFIPDVLNGKREPIPPDCPPAISNLIKMSWFQNPNKRPEIKEVLRALPKP